jgi:hypothetical protein
MLVRSSFDRFKQSVFVAMLRIWNVKNNPVGSKYARC